MPWPVVASQIWGTGLVGAAHWGQVGLRQPGTARMAMMVPCVVWEEELVSGGGKGGRGREIVELVGWMVEERLARGQEGAQKVAWAAWAAWGRSEPS